MLDFCLARDLPAFTAPHERNIHYTIYSHVSDTDLVHSLDNMSSENQIHINTPLFTWCPNLLTMFLERDMQTDVVTYF
jgi:hypothetical protein